MFCPNCGMENAAHAAECRRCRAPLHDAPAVVVAADEERASTTADPSPQAASSELSDSLGEVCRRCESYNEPGTRRCTTCGYKLIPDDDELPAPTAKAAAHAGSPKLSQPAAHEDPGGDDRTPEQGFSAAAVAAAKEPHAQGKEDPRFQLTNDTPADGGSSLSDELSALALSDEDARAAHGGDTGETAEPVMESPADSTPREGLAPVQLEAPAAQAARAREAATESLVASMMAAAPVARKQASPPDGPPPGWAGRSAPPDLKPLRPPTPPIPVAAPATRPPAPRAPAPAAPPLEAAADKVCGTCGMANPPAAKFCSDCGTPFFKKAAPAPPAAPPFAAAPAPAAPRGSVPERTPERAAPPPLPVRPLARAHFESTSEQPPVIVLDDALAEVGDTQPEPDKTPPSGIQVEAQDDAFAAIEEAAPPEELAVADAAGIELLAEPLPEEAAAAAPSIEVADSMQAEGSIEVAPDLEAAAELEAAVELEAAAELAPEEVEAEEVEDVAEEVPEVAEEVAEAAELGQPIEEAPYAVSLVVEKGSGSGTSYLVAQLENSIGGVGAAIELAADPHLAAKQATLLFEEQRLVVRDEGAANGVYLKIRESAPLEPGDCFIAGERLLRFDGPVELAAAQEGDTPFQGAPRPQGTAVRITEVLLGGRSGRVCLRAGPIIAVGKTGCDLNFPADGQLAARHAEVRLGEDGSATVNDLGAAEGGVYVRLKPQQSRELQGGDVLVLGEQRLRVDLG